MRHITTTPYQTAIQLFVDGYRSYYELPLKEWFSDTDYTEAQVKKTIMFLKIIERTRFVSGTKHKGGYSYAN
jgi:hypothetical protein